jgi:hypothetical protein
MRKIIVLFFGLVFLFAQVRLNAEIKKYDIKSGIVTYNLTMKVGEFALPAQKIVVYFDDYGMKECKDTYNGKVLGQSYFSNGSDLYQVGYAHKTASKQGKAYRGTELRVSWDEFSDRDKKAGKVKKAPEMTIAGKNCEVFIINDGKGQTTKLAGYKGVLMMIELNSGSTYSLLKAVSSQENAKVPADKFKVPAGFKIK